MAQRYPEELQAIQALRDRFPTVPQGTLAKRINRQSFDLPYDLKLAASVIGRTYYSVYSVIRRYDARKQTTLAA